MLLACSSCNSKYLLNSADLKPDGKTVQCIKCGYQWFQKPDLEEEVIKLSTLSDNKEKNSQKETFISNLPSTFHKENKSSILNSLLIIFFIVMSTVIIWFIQHNGISIIALFNYYIQEFYFNLQLIINDLAKLIHQIIN